MPLQCQKIIRDAVSAFFEPLQENILAYREKLSKEDIVFDKTNKMFLELKLNILEYLGNEEDSEKLDQWCEYNIRTMGNEFAEVINSQVVNDKTKRTLLMFFLRIAKEMEVKYGSIENEYLRELYTIMRSKDYKYPDYITSQKNFTLEIMPDKIEWMEYLKS